MSWMKSGLPFAAGGLAVLALTELMKEGKEKKAQETPEKDSVDNLIEQLHREARAALTECKTEEEREIVREEIRARSKRLQKLVDMRLERMLLQAEEEADDEEFFNVPDDIGEEDSEIDPNEFMLEFEEGMAKISRICDERIKELDEMTEKFNAAMAQCNADLAQCTADLEDGKENGKEDGKEEEKKEESKGDGAEK